MSETGYYPAFVDDVVVDGPAERRRQMALLKTGVLQTAILNSANFSSIATDENGVIQIFNVGAERMLGYAAADVLNNLTPADICDPDEVVARARSLSLELETPILPGFEALVSKARCGIEDVYELTYIRKDGSRFPALVSVSALRSAPNRIIGYLLIGTDNSARKRVEAERLKLDQALRETNLALAKAKTAAEKANHAKSEFLSGMSHELRSPLNTIVGFAQLMDSDDSPAKPSHKGSIRQILHAGWYLLELINEILDLARIESGTMSLSEQPVALAEVLLECRDMIEPQALKRRLRLSFPETSTFVRADRTRLKQVLVNLLSNAIKYTPSGGSVGVECAAGLLGRMRISVKDTGAGLSTEKLMRLFEPFNRLGQESSSEEGTGLGLVMSKRVVELMGGVIGVESTVGVGSVFWFELEGAAPPDDPVGRAELATIPRTGVDPGKGLRTLLYVEDNPASLRLVEELVARRPEMSMLSAENGQLGIELARERQPEMILMDINLPGISGIEAMRILSVDPATAHIPIVALSANAMPRAIENGMKAGFFNYLTKPIRVDEFMGALDAALAYARKHPKKPAGDP